jgi:hypothetical protein
MEKKSDTSRMMERSSQFGRARPIEMNLKNPMTFSNLNYVAASIFSHNVKCYQYNTALSHYLENP